MRRVIGRLLVWWLALFGQALAGQALVEKALAGPLPTASAAIPAVAGWWKIARADSSKACTIKLNGPDAGTGGVLRVGVPASCHRAIPVLSTVVSWALTEKGDLELADSGGARVLSLAHADDGHFTAPADNGAGYDMTPVGGRYDVARRTQQVETAVSAVTGTQANPNLPAEASGLWHLLRGAMDDSGCTLRLALAVGPRLGLGSAMLDPACTDQGLKTFDPVGWHVEGGDRLFLTARKGHSIGLTRDRGGWTKDPAYNAPLRMVR